VPAAGDSSARRRICASTACTRGSASSSALTLGGNSPVYCRANSSFSRIFSSRASGESRESEPSAKHSLTLKYGFFQRGNDKCLKIEASPDSATIRYTTDGSNPRVAGALYDGPFALPRGTTLVQAYGELDGVESEVERIPVSWDKRDEEVVVDRRRPAIFKRAHKFDTTRDSYAFVAMLKQHSAAALGVMLSVSTEGGREYVELNTHKDGRVSPELIEETLQVLRKIQSDGNVQVSAEALAFESGQELYDWTEAAQTTLRLGEVKQ
jgi:hypothetical protein